MVSDRLADNSRKRAVHFQVTAYNAAGDSAKSTVASVTPS